MDEKLKKELLEIYDSLTDEQKEKVKECKTMEEVSAFAAEEGIELPDEMLDDVAGGYVHKNGLTYEVINDETGNVMETFWGRHPTETWIKAATRARALGQKTDMITDQELYDLRKNAPKAKDC